MTIKPAHIIGSTARTLLALTFLFSGFVKAVDPLGTVYKIEDYLKAFGGFFTDLLPLAGIAAVCLIATEWLLGVELVDAGVLSFYDPADALDSADESYQRLRLFRGCHRTDQLADILEERGIPEFGDYSALLQETYPADLQLVDGDSTRRARSRIRSRYHGI